MKVTVFNKLTKKNITYENIHTITCIDIFGNETTFTGDELLTCKFPTSDKYQLLSDDSNYFLDNAIIGSIEVKKVL